MDILNPVTSNYIMNMEYKWDRLFSVNADQTRSMHKRTIFKLWLPMSPGPGYDLVGRTDTREKEKCGGRWEVHHKRMMTKKREIHAFLEEKCWGYSDYPWDFAFFMPWHICHIHMIRSIFLRKRRQAVATETSCKSIKLHHSNYEVMDKGVRMKLIYVLWTSANWWRICIVGKQYFAPHKRQR